MIGRIMKVESYLQRADTPRMLLHLLFLMEFFDVVFKAETRSRFQKEGSRIFPLYFPSLYGPLLILALKTACKRPVWKPQIHCMEYVLCESATQTQWGNLTEQNVPEFWFNLCQ